MAHTYMTERELQDRDKRREEHASLDKNIAERNNMLVGLVKNYRGIDYQMMQNGNYKCIGLPASSPLEGSYNSTAVLHKHIDDMLKKEGS